MNSFVEADVQDFAKRFPCTSELKGKQICVTGATGLIGSILVKCLLALNQQIRIVIPVRSKKKAYSVFAEVFESLEVVEVSDWREWTDSVEISFDYIVHCACPTSGKYMTEHPVDTFDMMYQSTYSLLRLAEKCNIKSFVYVSSLESYGQILNDDVITENVQGYVDLQDARSSYPMGKRAAEFLCTAFSIECGVPVKVARLTQTFGAGVSCDDNRVYAQFARSVINGTDIVLHTTGESSKPYCYTIDTVSAILYILLKGKSGEVYNVANEDTYISIKDLAEFLKENFNDKIDVRVELHPELGYAPVTQLRLSSKKLMDLGWKPVYNLKLMFEKLINSMK
ncbi:MAG: NAD(P)-dependent oxidoreductase [Paludibacteraceae bacterium]|nr:NAD(P)-dependent oxidoreductase [Paludibacteraceae bacterium]MCQ2218219.1 NAD(P)-dependent oxidoreductase [Paludibacteraceae bacterium]